MCLIIMPISMYDDVMYLWLCVVFRVMYVFLCLSIIVTLSCHMITLIHLGEAPSVNVENKILLCLIVEKL
jgi:hypothetical protein